MNDRVDETANCGGGWITRRQLVGAASGTAALALLARVGLDAAPASANAWGSVVWPVDNPPTPDTSWGQHFGAARPWPNGTGTHTGSDYIKGYNTPVRAIAAGTVVEATNGGCGGQVIVQHAGGLRSRYQHLRPPSISGTVAAGGLIGYVGDHNLHGTCSSADHLHLSIYVNAVAINPHAFLLANAGGGPGGNSLDRWDSEMWYIVVGGSGDFGAVNNGVAPIRAGYSYIQSANGVLRPVGSTESNARQQSGQSYLGVQSSQLGPMAERLGVMEVTWSGLEPTPTGVIRYGSNLTLSRPAW